MRSDTKDATASAGEEAVPWRIQLAVYAAGAFSHSLNLMANIAIPLWVIALGAPPTVIGLVLGARYALLAVLSIHGGALMDRFGTRRMMIALGVIGVAAHFAYPAVPWIGALIALQAIAGFAGSAGWLGSQVFIGQYMKADATYTGRLSFALRIAAFCGPPIVGVAWDLSGAWGAFTVLALWMAAGTAAALALPADPTPLGRVRAIDLLPRPVDYLDALRLALVPAIGLMVAITVLRHIAVAVQNSFYVVWLDHVGISGTRIGLLMSAWSILGSVAALAAGRLARSYPDQWLVIVTVALQIALISATPLLPGYAALFIAMALYGGCMGISQPLMISVMARRTSHGHQGKSAGLRNTANQFASTLMPPVMGAIAALVGLGGSFYVIGGASLALMALCALAVARSPDFGRPSG